MKRNKELAKLRAQFKKALELLTFARNEMFEQEYDSDEAHGVKLIVEIEDFLIECAISPASME